MEHYGRVNLPAGGFVEGQEKGKSIRTRIEIRGRYCEKKRKKLPLESNFNRLKGRIMKAWGHRANVAFCTVFFVYQVCP